MDTTMHSTTTMPSLVQTYSIAYPTSYSDQQQQYYAYELASPFTPHPDSSRLSYTTSQLRSDAYDTGAAVASAHDEAWLDGQANQQSTQFSPSDNAMTASRLNTTTTYPLVSQALSQHADTMQEQQWVAIMQAPTTPQKQEHDYPSHAMTSDDLHNPARSHYEYSPASYHSSERSPATADGGYRSSGSDESVGRFHDRVTWSDSPNGYSSQPTSMPSPYDDALYGAAVVPNVPRTQVDLSPGAYQRHHRFEGHAAPSYLYSPGGSWHQDGQYRTTERKISSSPSVHSCPSGPSTPYHEHDAARMSGGSSTASFRLNEYSLADGRYECQSSIGSTSPSVQQAYPLYPHDIKRKKVEMACHFCRARKLKCDGEHPTCTQCDRRDQACTWDSAVRRRGKGAKKNEKEEKPAERQTRRAGVQRRSTARTSTSQQTRGGGELSGDESFNASGHEWTFPNINSQPAIASQKHEAAPISPSDFASYRHGQFGCSALQAHNTNPTIVKAEDGYEAEMSWGSNLSSYPTYSSYDRTTEGWRGHQAGLGYGPSASSFPYAPQHVYSSTPSSLMGAVKDPMQRAQENVEREGQSWLANVGGSQGVAIPNQTEEQAAENWLLEQCS